MYHVVNPSNRLLDAKISPFCFCHEVCSRYKLGDVFWQKYVPAENNDINSNKQIQCQVL